MSTDVAKKGPDHFYKVGAVRFGRYGWFQWEANRDGRGCGGHLTPIGAYLALRRFLREPLTPNEVMPRCNAPSFYDGGEPCELPGAHSGLHEAKGAWWTNPWPKSEDWP